MPQNNNPNPISQEFMNKANEQFGKIKELNLSKNPSVNVSNGSKMIQSNG
ncbi:MAG TPA: hypothetical protein LFW10_02480 [Rickettsia endosymbiont of Diachasma alloeum]|nr:hypothetical protein [Rickettsia endosymbiont of Diachasma alloeum]